MDKPLISVIVPVYNAEAFLQDCVRSIIEQTYSQLEILLINDGSSDQSGALCDRLAEEDDRVRVFHQENRGVSAARNVGLDNATGDYVMFVDSDDCLLPDAAEFLLADAIAHNADMASAVKETVKPGGEIINPYGDGALHIHSGLDPLILSLDGERQTNSVCAKLFRREFLTGIRFEEGRSINEDGFFLFLCYMNQPTQVQHNRVVYQYFVRENSNSRGGFSEKYLDMLYFAGQKKEMVLATYPQLSDRVINMEVSAHLFFLEALCRTTDKKYRRYQKESVALVRRWYRQYHPLNRHECDFAKIVRYGLYPLYKVAIRIKRRGK